jgi:hypothetical protein
MHMTCKYHYRGGLCANSQVQSPFCVGENNCDIINAKPGAKEDSSSAVLREEDELSQWLGVYCPHYQRFFCTGETDGCKTGCCATPEDYHKSLAETLERLK